eukprot:4415376-Alexandrium_andersonii.AAC.1
MRGTTKGACDRARRAARALVPAKAAAGSSMATALVSERACEDSKAGYMSCTSSDQTRKLWEGGHW